MHACTVWSCIIACGTACRDWTLQDGDQLFVSGNLPQLGNWQQDQPLLLSEVQTPFWEAEVGSQVLRAAVLHAHAPSMLQLHR